MISSLVKRKSQGQVHRKALFERLVDDTYRQAFSMAYRLAGNRAEAEDLLQETYIRAYRFFHRYDEALPFNAWLYRIMTNIHIDNVRRKSRIKTISMDHSLNENGAGWDLEDDQAETDSNLMSSNLEEPFQRALLAMNSEFRTAVVLADVEGLSYEEIAEIMETSVGTVRSRIHRGRKQLRAHLESINPKIREVYNR